MLVETRRYVLRLVDGLSDGQLRTVPEGEPNHILWHLGHLVVTQQLLTYGRSGLALRAPEALVAQCRKGTSPADWTGGGPNPYEVKRLLLTLPEQFEQDRASGAFSSYEPYPTSTGVTLRSLDEAARFNLFHEGLHARSIARQRRMLEV
jgi:hypothetical protein